MKPMIAPAENRRQCYAEILGAAEEAGADLIVVGSYRPAMRDYLLGTNASRVVRHTDCSVLVARD
jgi:nucleotide-binding universal stress UspA family protein